MIDLVLAALKATKGIDGDADTKLLGNGAVIDSLGLVTLIVEIEMRLEAQGKPIRIMSEAAMSQRRSPFLTVATLAEYLDDLLSHGQ